MRIAGARPIFWILLGGAIVAFGWNKNRSDVAGNRRMLRSAAARYGLNPDWIDAIARHESGWNARAINLGSADAKYGGAWGLTQILLTNLRNLGWTKTPQEYLADVYAQADISAKFAAQGPKTSFRDFAAWWNSGKRSFDLAPTTTRTVYVPKVTAALDYVARNPVV